MSDVRSYEFGGYEIVYYCVMGGSWNVLGEGFLFFLDFHVWGLWRR